MESNTGKYVYITSVFLNFEMNFYIINLNITFYYKFIFIFYMENKLRMLKQI